MTKKTLVMKAQIKSSSLNIKIPLSIKNLKSNPQSRSLSFVPHPPRLPFPCLQGPSRSLQEHSVNYKTRAQGISNGNHGAPGHMWATTLSDWQH